MNIPDPVTSTNEIKVLKPLLDVASALFGLLGTWLMSRRYARQFGRSVLFALISPLLLLLGQGARVRRFMAAKINANCDLPDSVTDMALGLNLLFWAFFLQLLAAIVDWRH
jgi:hypothetical protein